MSMQQLANDTANEILVSLGGDVSRSDEVSRIIQKALLTVLQETQAGCVDAVNICCSSDQDLAHKISEEIRQKEKAIITNLSSLR